VSEPREVAQHVEEIAPGVWHWRIHDDRIDYVSSSHAVSGDAGTVLIDPLPLAPEALAQLGRISAICLTTSSHQRSSWRLRRELGVEVWAPALVKQVEEEPDHRYSEDDLLPGGLVAVFTPGAGTTQHTLLLGGDPGVAFTPDLFVHPSGGPLAFVSAQYMHDPEEARRSAEKLLGLSFSILCTGHGLPVIDDPHAAIRAALES
jgi:glyoxylase-like metal-dependent hydrolase (beta-lactamase superfamily II)